MGPVAAWPAQLLPHVPCRDTRPREPAATHTPMAPLTAEQLYVVTAALLADGGESFVHHHGPAQIAGSIQGTQRDAPHPWHATLRERTCVRDAGGGAPPPAGPEPGQALVLQVAGYQALLHGHAGGYRSHILADGRWTVWHGTTRQEAFPPHVDWQQEPTQAYYMTADPWPLAVLLHTISASAGGRNRGGPTPLHWSGASTRKSIYGPHGRETPSGPRTSRISTRGQSRTPARRPPLRWPSGESRTHSG